MVTEIATKCSFNHKCKDVDTALCESCRHNEKRSYYEPYRYEYPYYPYWPYYWPYYPWTVTWGDSTDDIGIATTSYYSHV